MKTNQNFKKLGLSLAISAICCSPAWAAFDDAGTDYRTDEQRSHVWNEALEPLELANSILCFTDQMRTTDFVNDGPYLVLADEERCFGSDDDSGGSGSSAPQYVEVIVDVTRESDLSPLVISAWMPEMGDDEHSQAIKFKALIAEGASESNPFGTFIFNFDFFNNIEDSNRRGGGELRTVDIENHIGFTLFESDQRGDHVSSQSASAVMTNDRSEGYALTAVQWGDFGHASALAFNDDHVLVQGADNYDSLGFQNGDNEGQCLSRTEFNDTVHRYDLYDAETGERVELNSGFSFRYDSDGNDVNDSHGHVGYWGIWTDDENALADGDEITKENFNNNSNPETFTVVRAPGKLIKKTVERLSLDDAAGIDFQYWSHEAQEAGYNNFLVQYRENGFYIVAGMSHGQDGEQITELTPTLIQLESFDSLYMHSEQLGGEVRYQSGDTHLSFYQEQVINGAGDVFANGALELHCFERCPIGTLEASDLQNYDGVNSPYEAIGDDAIVYSFGETGSNALTLVRDSNSEPVVLASSVSVSDMQSSSHQWGVASGMLVDAATAATLQNHWDVYDPEVVSTFYIWETGPNNWNQLSAVKDSDGNFISFDKPIQIRYTHSDAKDRSGDARDFDGQVFMLNYGGNGDFWGIPHQQESERHQPLFAIADGAAVDSDNNFVVKAREIEQQMATADGQCSSLTIQEPAAAVPTETQNSADIGTMPTITDAAKVIAGEIQISD
ncbi:hypothetical protein [Agaribacterium sp. ZY112]|uniref:hypothetical protein n=1 Tax=Agaribacterium sp. ZY112 TaxID=3233574 RepID=UPI003523D433